MDVSLYLATAPSGLMLDRSGRLMCAFLNDAEQWCFPQELEQVSPYLVQATIAAEDQRFYSHPGVDPIAVLRAAAQNVLGGRVVSGASTLTMQVVKQADDTPRTLRGKAKQAIQALRLERCVGKEDILQEYLNTAPYGLNLVGCEAAAHRYFGKPALELTLPEAALLAGLPKAPTKFMPLEHPKRARERRNHVLRRMRDEGYIDENTYRRAEAAPLGAEWHAFPMRSPHLAMSLRQNEDAPAVCQRPSVIRLTLDAEIQATAEQLTRRWLNRFQGEVTNAALIAVDAADASVLARVGSADFFNTPGGGQFDACRALRAPGSTLKPFTYALAIEKNRLYASEMLFDGSLDYGLYVPENYDGCYHGLVSASEALQRSLNVPAVTVLERLGYNELGSFLAALGISTLSRAPEYYGLGLTLGNCEMTLDELAAAYCTLANLGDYRPLRFVAGAAAVEPTRRLSRGTCAALYAMLEQPLPAEFRHQAVHATAALPRVCWKTGTSTRHRDAWAFVFNRHYVVGVWLGNNDATPSNRLFGARAALPLAARMFRLLPPKASPAWPIEDAALREAAVCAVTGLPASRWCPHTRAERVPNNQYLNRTCDVHYPARHGKTVAERWPGAARQWDLAKILSPIPAAASAGVQNTRRTEALEITAPSDQAEYVLTGEANGDRLTLHASLDNQTQLHWYADGRYLGSSKPQRPVLLDLTFGEHTLACMTTDGSIDTVAFAVIRADGPAQFVD